LYELIDLMGRVVILIGVCLIVIGVLINIKVPLSWIGHLPGDLSFTWGATRIYIPFTTSIIFSLLLSVLIFIFTGR